ncbi:MAG: hypothetical protein ACR2H0_05030 [Candidatus Limnocylindrales bacterium]
MRAMWSGTDELSLWVVNPSGEIISHKHGDSIYVEFDLRAGDYTFTVLQLGDDQVTYKVVITYDIVE